MGKRFLAAILTLCLLVSLVPAAHAWEEDIGLTKTDIMVWQQGYRALQVYKDGDDLLMTPAQLSWLTGFASTEGSICTFTRGSKTVKVDTDAQLIYMAGATHGIYLPSACRHIGGTWYLSAAGVLPWLNTHCTVKDGVLIAVPNAVSVWDEIESFNLTDYSFDFEGICDSISVSPSTLKTGAFLTDNGLGALAYLVPDSQNSSMGEENDYYDLLSDMIQDVTATDRSVNTWLERYGKFGDVLDFFSTGIGFMDEELGDAFDSDSITYTKNGLRLLAYCALFDQDGASKTGVLQTLINGADSGSNSGMISAAIDVIQDYSDIWEGIYNKVKHDVIDGLFDELTSGTVLSLLGFAVREACDSSTQVARISMYQNLMAEGLDGYRCYSGETTLQHLENYVNFIQLYLYSSEQNHRAMAAYMEDVWLENSKYRTQCLERADAIEAVLAQFINISTFLEDDCSDKGLKNTATKEYLELFGQLHSDMVPKGITAAAEHAIYRAALEDMGVTNIGWDVTDLDSDGEAELLVVCDDLYADWPSYIVIDPNNYTMGSYTDNSYMAYTYLRKTGDGQYRFLRKYDTGTEVLPVDTMAWTGTGFTALALEDSLQETSLPCPDLTEQTFSGSTAALLKQLDSYFDTRSGSRDFSFDLNGDGSDDRIYLFLDGVDLWTRQCNPASSFGGERHLYYDDDKATVLTAETQSEGVKLRVCRLDLPNVSLPELQSQLHISEEDRTIVIGDYQYTYQPTGAPFVGQQLPEYGPCAADLLGLTPMEVRAVLDEYYEDTGPDGETAYGYYQGAYLSMTYSGGVLTELSVSAWSGERVPLIDGVYTGDTLVQMLEHSPSLADWTDFELLGGVYYATSSSYRDDSGNNYIFTAAFEGTDPHSTLAFATFTLT